jgi:hypothetical protein
MKVVVLLGDSLEVTRDGALADSVFALNEDCDRLPVCDLSNASGDNTVDGFRSTDE